ncbi:MULTISPECIES: NlpC/P60 family N-terminal domain-containing protein [unclassified Desulfovibrio]|uniref:NlpC/P60 family N-terminal domain-containing protein n=1 Tax=unclassified Desulfovibrio TaxID=2593640 RepID=UPI0013EB05CD|nr:MULTISPECIES: NlpC/P60 family N-terminal domain-containing protein [unclassified Desulfovibrio]
MPSSRFSLLVLLLALCLLTACAGKRVPTRDGSLPSWMQTPQDLRAFPQDLEVFAREAGPDRRIVDAETQDAMNAAFDRIFFGPWDMAKTSIRKRDVAVFFRKARGFRADGSRWSQPEWDAMAAGAHLGTYPSRAAHAVTVRATDLRELPTHEPRFSEPTPDPKANPFDYFQYSLLPPGTPLLIAHATRDERWYYVECPVAGGWVDANDVALVDAGFKRLWRRGRHAALVRDRVALPGAPGAAPAAGGEAGIGAVFPLAAVRPDGGCDVLVPFRGADGMAASAEVSLPAGAAAPKPLALTPGNVARVGNVMMGQPYGWGGMFGERDCSALTRDLFTPFGIWLPRNSVAQARRGAVVPLEGLSAREKEARILADGVPFLSLVGMRGHIMLYVGAWKGRPAIFHNVWGVRVVEDGNDNARCVIGRAVVTSLTPGSELKNLYLPVTFVDRIRTLTTPAGPRP